MKRSKNGEDKENIQILLPMLPGEHEIIRRTSADGTITCLSTVGNQEDIEPDSQEFDFTVACILDNLKTLTEFVIEKQCDIGMLYKTLIAQVELRFNEIFEFVYEDIGSINILSMAATAAIVAAWGPS